MYFALKSIGKDNEEKINNLTSLYDKWQLIDRIAKNDGYNGIQFSNPFYGIPIDNLPGYIKKFALCKQTNIRNIKKRKHRKSSGK